MATAADPQLANRILGGLVLGAVAGALVLLLGGPLPWLLEGARQLSTAVFDPLGQIFLRLLFFVVMPLVFASLACGVAQLGDLGRLGPLSARTFTVFFFNMSIACLLGLVMMNLLQPGAVIDGDTKARLVSEYGGASAKLIEKQAAQPDMSFSTVVDMFMPRNLLGAITGHDRAMLGEVLPLILFAILVGAAAVQLGGRRREQLQSGLELVSARHDIQRRGEGRLGHPAGFGLVRAWLSFRDAAASVWHDVALAEIFLALFTARFLAAYSTRARHCVLDEFEQRHAARGARLGAR